MANFLNNWFLFMRLYKSHMDIQIWETTMSIFRRAHTQQTDAI